MINIEYERTVLEVGAVKKRRYDMSSRAASAQQTRVRILEAAYKLFVDHPFDEVTFARIAEAAGVSVPTVVLHFRTKDGLTAAMLEYWKPKEQALRDVEDGDVVDAARKVCARYEHNGHAVLRLLAMEEQSPAVRPILAHGRATHREWVERTWGARLGTGAVRERRIMELVVAYDLYTWHVLRRVLDAEATIAAMAELARGVLEHRGRR